MTWLARVASVAALSNGVALTTAYFWPAAATGFWERALVITLPLALLTWINVLGVRAGARAAVFLTIGKTLPLLLFIGAGAFFVDRGAFRFEAPRKGTLTEAALLLLFAYAGFENTPAAAGEYRNPRRDVPFALFLMILFVTLLYTSVQAVAIGTLPGLAEAKSPLAEAAAGFLGHPGALLMSLGALISIVGNIGSTTLSGPRYLFALAMDGHGPRVLTRVHPTHRTPALAILTQSALALSGSFQELVMLSAIARLATYLGTAAAVPVLRKRFGRRPEAVRLPGGAAIPLAAVLVSIVFLASAKRENLIAGAIALAAGAAIYAFRRQVG
jgi:amino acid transporter